MSNDTIERAPADFATIFAATGMSAGAIDTLHDIYKAAEIGGAYEGCYARKEIAELEAHDMFMESCKFSESMYMYPSPRALQMISDATGATFLTYFDSHNGVVEAYDENDNLTAVLERQQRALAQCMTAAQKSIATNPWHKRVPNLYWAHSELIRPGYDGLRFSVTTNYPKIFKAIDTFDALALNEEREAA